MEAKISKKDSKMQTAGRAALYTACGVLILFYLAVLWLSVHPEVCMEYRMYYLTHELTDWPGYGKLSYELGTLEYCTGYYDKNGEKYTHLICRRKGQGWEKYQNEGSINRKENAYLYYLPTTSQERAGLYIHVNDFSGENAVWVYANDKPVGSFTAAGKFEFEVSDVKEQEMLIVRFEGEAGSFRLWQAALYARP